MLVNIKYIKRRSEQDQSDISKELIVKSVLGMCNDAINDTYSENRLEIAMEECEDKIYEVQI